MAAATTKTWVGRATDEGLLELVAGADYDAFVELYGRYDRAAYGLALRVTKDATLAEDVTVEAFLAIWKNTRRYDASRGSARSWIFTIVHRRAVDCVRREQRHRRQAAAFAAPPDDVPPPSAAVFADETRGEMRFALDVLPERERELIQLAYYDGYTQREIAVMLRLPLGTVKSRMWAGLGRLREALAGREHELLVAAAS